MKGTGFPFSGNQNNQSKNNNQYNGYGGYGQSSNKLLQNQNDEDSMNFNTSMAGLIKNNKAAMPVASLMNSVSDVTLEDSEYEEGQEISTSI